jgi:Cupin superfamily protein
VLKLGDIYPTSPPDGKERGGHRNGSEEPTETLRQFVAPLPLREFLSSCFRQRAVHVPASVAGSVGQKRLQFLTQELFDLDPESILGSTASENIFVWLRRQQQLSQDPLNPKGPSGDVGEGSTAGQAVVDRDLIHSIEVNDPGTALALHRAGHATYCRAPPALERHLVSRLMAGSGLGCGQYDPTAESSTCMGRGEVEVFLGTAGHCTNWHWDFQENFTIQLSGTKRWTLQKGSVSHPLRGCTPHYKSPESVEPQIKAARLVDPHFQFGYPDGDHGAVVEQVTMHPGDVLYFPAGMWHKVEVLEPGVSMNVSLMATNYATVTCQALQHLLLQKEEWRACVVNNPNTDAIAALKSLLQQLPSIIEEFGRHGGADAILPPVVRTPPAAAFQGDDEFSEDDNNDDAEDDGVGDVIDVTRQHTKAPLYECTERQLRDQLATHSVTRNPLATMVRESDIFKFYKANDDAPDDEDSSDVYVLNVNYAGNESHESFARARILGSGTLLPHLYESTRDKNRQELLPDAESWITSEPERRMLGCLVYHGFLLWVARPS